MQSEVVLTEDVIKKVAKTTGVHESVVTDMVNAHIRYVNQLTLDEEVGGIFLPFLGTMYVSTKLLYKEAQEKKKLLAVGEDVPEYSEMLRRLNTLTELVKVNSAGDKFTSKYVQTKIPRINKFYKTGHTIEKIEDFQNNFVENNGEEK